MPKSRTNTDSGVPAPPDESAGSDSMPSRDLLHDEGLASIGILAAGVAHEIQNPLASILAGVDSLRRRLREAAPKGLSVEDAFRVLDLMERETIRARDITTRMMQLAQPEIELPGWLDLNQVLEDTVALLRFQCSMQKIDVQLELAASLGPIQVRGAGIRSVCMNLMMNAVQAMPHGGALVGRTRRSDHRIVFEVEDTGPGISPEFLDRIWDPFFTTKPPGKGTGLGLSLSKTIVERYGGVLRVQNVEPHGARFTVDLPEHPGR